MSTCEWWKCTAEASGYRTDIGGTTFALCPPHVNLGSERGYWLTRGTFASTSGRRRQRRKHGYQAFPSKRGRK